VFSSLISETSASVVSIKAATEAAFRFLNGDDSVLSHLSYSVSDHRANFLVVVSADGLAAKIDLLFKS
jgi:hypothetical protein